MLLSGESFDILKELAKDDPRILTTVGSVDQAFQAIMKGYLDSNGTMTEDQDSIAFKKRR